MQLLEIELPPLIQVHSFVEGLNIQRSFSAPKVLVEWIPLPLVVPA